MPKMKPNKGAAKRFRITGSGKVMARKAWGAHLMKSKSKSRQVRLKGAEALAKPDAATIKKLLGK
ncbi:MAG TPA: 50S ribosomal protein L35 [Actinomycetota bacterium]|nr:50S ribosomal protein L35 [Actinomycetota bacterium]